MCSSSKLLVRLSPQGKKWGKLFGFRYYHMSGQKDPCLFQKDLFYFNSYIKDEEKIYQVVNILFLTF